MFRKPIKIKSNTPVKNSERKLIRDKISRDYPILTENDLNNIFPKKEILNSVKITTGSDETVQVYVVQKRPICFELRGRIIPTIYLLWKYPSMVHHFTTHKNVVNFINSGADLMLPGILTPPAHTSLPKYGSGIQKDDVVAVNLSDNKATFAVGLAAMGSTEMERSLGKGKGVTILHSYGDKLCSLEGQSCLPTPNSGSVEWLQLKGYDEDFPALGAKPILKNDEKTEQLEQEDKENIVEVIEVTENKPDVVKELTTKEVDELLHTCFFTAIKYSKTLSLPILTSNFYKLQMLPSCPPGQTLDIKKSSFKKLKPFLDLMCQENIISIKEFKKGVESIMTVNKTHPKFEAFYAKPEDRPGARKSENSTNNSDVSNVTESFVITNNVLPIFNSGETKMHKGDTVLGTSVRKHIREYVVNNKCQHENPRLIQLDQTLSAICKSTNPITWEEVYEKVCASMKNCFKVQNGQDEIFNKGKISPIVLSVSKRTNNKKVTLVDNLELFGVNITEFANKCRHGVAASTSINTSPEKKTEQLLIQGNQVLFVYNLLIETYKIPKRYIQGLENAPKKKK